MPTLQTVDARHLVFSDGQRLHLPDAVNVGGWEAWVPAGAPPRWKLTVPGASGKYDRGVQLDYGETLAVCVQAVEYLRRCVKQETRET